MPGLASLWHKESFPWHAAFIAVTFFYSFSRPMSLYCEKCVYIYIPVCVEIVYELALLPNNTASETFLHNWGAVQRVDWIFITGAPAWR
jgi:hypothetical protein